MGDKPKRGRGRRDVSAEIAEVRKAYEDGDTNLSALSKRFGVKRDTIARYRDSENWATKGQINDAARSNVIDIATRKALDKIGGVDHLAGKIAEELAAQPELIRAAGKLIKRTLDRALKLGEKDADGKPVDGQLILGDHQGETTAVSDLLNSTMKFVQSGKLMHGLGDDEPSVGEEEKATQPFVVVRKVLPPTGTDGAELP
jgi:hypothetical protein